MKSRYFASFSKVDFFYMESDLRGPQVLKAPTNSGFCNAFSALNMSNGGPVIHTWCFFWVKLKYRNSGTLYLQLVGKPIIGVRKSLISGRAPGAPAGAFSI